MMYQRSLVLKRYVAKYCTIAHRQMSNDNKSNVSSLLENSSAVESNNKQDLNDWATTPYSKSQTNNRLQGLKSIRPKINPKETSIILFPGQGSQFVGMAQKLIKIPEAKDLFQFANEILKFDLLKMCLEGPKNDLDKTKYSQPAILVTSLAALEKLKEERPTAIDNCIATAGFSLGEITALIFAGAIPFDQGLQLVQIRAEAMQAASDLHPSGMATVFYGPSSNLTQACEKAKEWCIDRGVEQPECRIATYLYPHCKVIAGNVEALKFIETNLKAFNLKKMKLVEVSGAFHTDLMESAVDPFRKALKLITIEDPIISVHSNIDGKRYRNAKHIVQQLPKQIVKPVKWEQTLHNLYERTQGEEFPRTFECGPGKTLISVLKQVNAKAADSAYNVDL